MTVDSFLGVLRRFISRRGKVRELRCKTSERTSSVPRTRTLLHLKSYKPHLSKRISSQDCDWIDFSRNTPALHVGGNWEWQIRTTGSVLSSLLLDHGTQLDGKSFRTLSTEAESIKKETSNLSATMNPKETNSP